MRRLLILMCLSLTGCPSDDYRETQNNVVQANAAILAAREATKQVRSVNDKIKVECQGDCKGLKVEIPTSSFGGQAVQDPLLAMPKAPKNLIDLAETVLHIADKNTGMFAISRVAVEGFQALKGSGESTNTTTITEDNSVYSSEVNTNLDLSKREENHDSKNDSSQHDSGNVSQVEENHDSKNDFSQTQTEENHDSKNDNSQHDSHDDSSLTTSNTGTSP